MKPSPRAASSSAISSARDRPRPRAGGATYMRLISAMPGSSRLTAPTVTGSPSSRPTRQTPCGRRQLLRRGGRQAGALDAAAVELGDLGDHRLQQLAGRRLAGRHRVERDELAGAGRGRCSLGYRRASCRATGATSSSPTGRRARRPSPTRQPSRRPRRGFLRRLRENLSKTREALAAEVQATLFDTLDDETWERLEEALIMADVGASTTAAGRREARARGDERRADRRRGARRPARRAARRGGARPASRGSTCATSRR